MQALQLPFALGEYEGETCLPGPCEVELSLDTVQCPDHVVPLFGRVVTLAERNWLSIDEGRRLVWAIYDRGVRLAGRSGPPGAPGRLIAGPRYASRPVF